MASTVEATCCVPYEKCLQFRTLSDCEGFNATLLSHFSGPTGETWGYFGQTIPQPVLPEMPAAGSRVVVRFCPDGFVVGQVGSAAAAGVVLAPSAHLEVGAAGGDPCVVSVAGAFPTWNVTLRFEGVKLADRFRQQVQTGCLQIVSWMHHVFEAERSGIMEPTCAIVAGTDRGPNRRDGPFLCGCYILFSMREDGGHSFDYANPAVFRAKQRRYQPRWREPSYCLRWMELRGPLVELGGIVELRFYNHHGPSAHLLDVVVWENNPNGGCAVEVAGHVIYFREPEPRDGYFTEKEVKPLMILTLRSAVEAEAVVDIATSAGRDRGLLIDAQRRLQQPPPQRQVMQRSRQPEVGPQCFVRADRDLVHVASATLDAGALYWRNYYEEQRNKIMAALAVDANRDPSAYHAQSDTVVFSNASGTVQFS